MDKDFELFISRFLLQYGKEILNDSSKCKSLLKDFAKGEFQKEIRLLILSIEIGAGNKIVESVNIEETAAALCRKLQDNYAITEEAAFDVISLLCRILRNIDIKSPVSFQNRKVQSTNKRKAERQPITLEMIEPLYMLAKEMFTGYISKAQAITALENSHNWTGSTAGMYLDNFKLMMNGQFYNRIMSFDLTNYFLEHIYQDFGKDGLQHALLSLKQHIDYLVSLGKSKPIGLQKLYIKYNSILTEANK